MATLDDVARTAGVAPSTVSRVMNERAISVAPETRRRILQVAADLGYRPNAHAWSLRLHSTRTAGVPGLTNPFFPEVLEGIRNAAVGYYVCRAAAFQG